MNVEIKIKRENLPSYDKLHFVYFGRSEEVDFKEVIYEVRSLHDRMFGGFQLIFYKNGFLQKRAVGVFELKTIELDKMEVEREYTLNVYSGKYINRCDVYELTPREVVGTITIQFSFKPLNEKSILNREGEGSFFFRVILPLFSKREEIDYFMTLKRTIDDVFRGSNSCRFNFIKGLFLLERYYSIRRLRTAGGKNTSKSELKDVHSEGDLGWDGTEGLSLENENKYSNNHERDGYRLYNREFYLRYRKFYYFAIASYGRFVLMNFIKRQKKIEDGEIEEPRKTVLEYLGIPTKDLLQTNLSTSKTSHIIFTDREEMSLVVSFRGTGNPDDAMRDLDCEYEEFFDGYAHKGIKGLSKAFFEENFDKIRELIAKLGLKKLILTGQSLGGAISILVGIMMEEKGLLCGIELEVIAFSPPPVVSLDFCEAEKYRNITVMVYGNDIVPRLCYGSVLDLKYLSTSIGSVKVEKKDEFKIIKRIKDHLREKNFYPKLHIPGRIFHMKKFYTKRKKGVDKNGIEGVTNMLKKKFNLFRSDREEMVLMKEVGYRFFNDIIIDRKSFIHHMFSSTINGLKLSLDQTSTLQK